MWHTPVPAAGVAVVGSDGVLCGRRAIEPGRGDWAVPGGHMEAGESPSETAVRELREEVGLDTDPDALRLVGTHSPSVADGKHMVVLDYAVPRRSVEGTPDPGPEVATVEWLQPDVAGDDPDRSFLDHHEELLRTAWTLLGDP